MTLLTSNILQLEEIRALLGKVPEGIYSMKRDVLSGASIGQHVRHLLEFYVTLEQGLKANVVCYDARARDLRIETDLSYSIQVVDKAIVFMSSSFFDKNAFKRNITLRASYGVDVSVDIDIDTTVERELAYCMDHAIHHLAIIKISLIESGVDLKMEADLGVASSTLRYREICAQ